MYTIKTLNKISPYGLARLDAASFKVDDSCETPDGILVRSADMLTMDFAPNLLAIGRAGAGTNNIPVAACAEQGIVVFNSPGANANAVKELVLCGLLMASRKIPEGIAWCAGLTDGDTTVEKQVEKGKSAFVGPEIKGKTLGVIGLGAIGVLVANAAVALGMKVIGTDPYLSVKAALDLNPKVRVAPDNKAVYAEADYITIHVPQNDQTKGMICAETIDQMRDGVRILNMARGGLVKTDDILAALASGKVACYVTDFPGAALVGKPGVIALPHLGASTPEAEDNCAVMAAEELADYLLNGNIRNSVNLPACEMERSGVQRVCIIHKNVPNVLSKLMHTLSAEGANVENMMNKSRGDMAYTIIDFGSQVSHSTVAVVEQMPEVIRTRVL